MSKQWKQLSLSLNKDRVQEPQEPTQRRAPQSDTLSRTTALAEHLGWNYNGILTGIYFKRAADIWKAVLKMENAAGPRVAYFTGTSLYQLVETVHWYASKGYVEWHRDTHPVRVSKRKGVYSHPTVKGNSSQS